MNLTIDYFLLAKNLTKRVKKTEIYPSIAPDHNAMYISLSGSSESPRGPGVWKFNNTLLKDEEYLECVRETYSNTVKYYRKSELGTLSWVILKQLDPLPKTQIVIFSKTTTVTYRFFFLSF